MIAWNFFKAFAWLRFGDLLLEKEHEYIETQFSNRVRQKSFNLEFFDLNRYLALRTLLVSLEELEYGRRTRNLPMKRRWQLSWQIRRSVTFCNCPIRKFFEGKAVSHSLSFDKKSPKDYGEKLVESKDVSWEMYRHKFESAQEEDSCPLLAYLLTLEGWALSRPFVKIFPRDLVLSKGTFWNKISSTVRKLVWYII